MHHLPIWMQNDLSVGLWLAEGEDSTVHSCFCGCCFLVTKGCVLNLPLRAEDNCMYTIQWFKIWTSTLPTFSPLPPALQGNKRRPCSVIRCLSVLEGSSDRLQEAVFMPDDGDHRKQKCLFVPPGLGMSTISRGQYQILPSSSPNTHSCVRSGGILHQREDKQPKAKPHTAVS